jgi:hypothetical protein
MVTFVRTAEDDEAIAAGPVGILVPHRPVGALITCDVRLCAVHGCSSDVVVDHPQLEARRLAAF